MHATEKKEYFLPLSLGVVVIILDQVSKLIIEKTIPQWSVGWSFFDGLINIVRVYNTGAAFSLGHGLNDFLRILTLGILPLIIMLAFIVIYFKNKTFTFAQRWFVSGIIGGGIGNLIDRFFRKQGVVDFIDVKFFNIFGLDRWPTFNIADSAIVICGIGLIITFLLQGKNTKNKELKEEEYVK